MARREEVKDVYPGGHEVRREEGEGGRGECGRVGRERRERRGGRGEMRVGTRVEQRREGRSTA